MELHYDIWLILLMLVASALTMFASFSFVNRLYRSSSAGRLFLLPIYSIALSSSLWSIQLLNWVAFQSGQAFLFSTPIMLSSLLAAWLAGFTMYYAASKKNTSVALLASCSIIAGLSSYAMFYLSTVAQYTQNNVNLDAIPLIIAIGLVIVVTLLAILTLSWMKDYIGEKARSIKVILSLLTAASIIGLHLAFSATVILQTGIQITPELIVTDKKMLGVFVALAIVCIFLLVFTIAMLYEKAGKNTFRLHALNRHKNLIASAVDSKDALTHLPNRRAFKHQLDIASKRCERTGKSIAIAYIDLDHFKPINDNYGHHIGDTVLTTVAQRLQAAVRGCDTVARLGGDEFVALIEEIDSTDDIIPIVERIVNSMKESFVVNHHQIEISCSVGIAIYPRDGDVEKLIICADAAMYKAKENGRNQFRFYDADVEFAADKMQEIYSDLQLALAQNQFKLLFQPKFDCQTHLPVGAEALVRWNHPTKGLITPKDFIAEAERFGFVNQINEWVMEEVCRTIAHAKKQGVDLNISINLARQQFSNANLVHEIAELLRNYEVPASNLTLEIKDTAAIKNEKQFKLILAQFKLAKIKIALDNFGMHPFTLSYLQELNIDELKLDRLFISKMSRNKSAKALVDAVIRLAHALGFNVVAEGVESDEQVRMLADLGCNHMQGYLLSRPVPQEQLLALYKQLSINFESSQMSLYQVDAA